MKPKKKSILPFIIGAMAFAFSAYLAFFFGIGFDKANALLESGTITEREYQSTGFKYALEQLAYNSSEIYWTDFTKKSLIYCCGLCGLILLMIYSSKKNYIHGKEFGTARWGTVSDVRDLFAQTIANKEIARIKRMKGFIGKKLVKHDMMKECKAESNFIIKQRLDRLNEVELERKKNKSYNKKLHEEEVKKIHKEEKEALEKAKLNAWKPDRYAKDCKEEIAEVKALAYLTDTEKQSQIDAIKKKYEEKTKDFFDTETRIAEVKSKYAHADMLFSQNYKMSFFNYVLNQNVLILGGSGAGKTRGYVIPNILQCDGQCSIVVTDPKGEILEKVGYFLTQKGYKIRCLNLNNKTLSDGYNPFAYIHPEREGYEERVLTLIETIIINTDGDKKGGGTDPFWDKAERLFLQAIFFFTIDGFVKEEQNMGTVMKLIAMLQIAEDEDNYDSDLDYFAKIFEERHGKEHIGVLQYKEFRSKASGKTAKSIVISAVARLAPFRTKEIKRITSYDNMDLDRVGEEKYAVFVITPPTDKSFNFVAGMLYTQLFQELQYCATVVHKHEGQRLAMPVKFILDEFRNTSEIPNFESILSYARSFGIGITIILQSLVQIKAIYEKEWGTILDNCNTHLYLGSISHDETLDYYSKLLGKGTFDKRTTGRTRGRQGSSSENFDVIGRELMLPDEIKNMPKDECLILFGGRPPLRDKKFDYTTHEFYRMTSDGNHDLSYEFKPLPPPQSELSHGEEKIQYPTEDLFIESPLIVYKEKEELSETVSDFAVGIKDGTQEFVTDLGIDASEEDYVEILKELDANNDSILDTLLEANKVVAEIEEETPKILMLSIKDSLLLLGRTFRNQDFIPNGFVTDDEINSQNLENHTEEKQNSYIKEVEEIIFEDEEENTSGFIDDSLSESGLQDDISKLLSEMEDDDVDELLKGI